ncbi:MAG TPA: hypothetical protein VGA53_02815 [Candidatus Paceibacterota bacterium]
MKRVLKVLAVVAAIGLVALVLTCGLPGVIDWGAEESPTPTPAPTVVAVQPTPARQTVRSAVVAPVPTPRLAPTATLALPPTPVPTPTVPAEGVWRCWVYDNADQSGEPRYSEDKGRLDYNWGVFPPREDIPRDYFSLDCLQNKQFPGGNVVFDVWTNDQNLLVTVGGKPVFLERNGPPERFKGEITVEEGRYEVRVKYADVSENLFASAYLQVDIISQREPVVPPTSLPSPTLAFAGTTPPRTIVGGLPPLQPRSSIVAGETASWAISIANRNSIGRTERGSAVVECYQLGRSVGCGSLEREIRIPGLVPEGQQFDVPQGGIQAQIVVFAPAGIQEQCYDKLVAIYTEAGGRREEYELVRNFCVNSSIDVRILANPSPQVREYNITNTARVDQSVRVGLDCPFSTSGVLFYIALTNQEITQGQTFVLPAQRASFVRVTVYPQVGICSVEFLPTA